MNESVLILDEVDGDILGYEPCRDMDGVLGGVIDGPTELARDKDVRCDDASSTAGGIMDHPKSEAKDAFPEGSLSSVTGDFGREVGPPDSKVVWDSDVVTAHND